MLQIKNAIKMWPLFGKSGETENIEVRKQQGDRHDYIRLYSCF